MTLKDNEKIEYKLKSGKIGKGIYREGRNFCYVQSENGRPIRIKEISAIRLTEEEEEQIDPKLQSAVEADLATYDLEKLKAMGDKSKDMIVNMGKLFLIKNQDYAKDADKNGKAYTKIAAEKAGLNSDGSEKSDEQKQAEENVKEVKKEGEAESDTETQENSENTEQVQESRKNRFIRGHYSRYKEDENEYIDDIDENDEMLETDENFDDEELLETQEIDEDSEQEVLDGIENVEETTNYDDVMKSLEDEENLDYNQDYENDFEEDDEIEEDDGVSEYEVEENEYEDSDESITLSNGETIELRDLFDKIKMDVEDKIEEILDEIESSEDEFSDEKIIDELSDEFDVDGKEVLAECGNVPDTVLRISEIVRERIMNKYLQN